MSANYHVTADIPADAPPQQRSDARAEAIKMVLIHASSDPGTRLLMILGDAYQRYLDLARWIAQEIEKDEAKAPGLTRHALLSNGVISHGESAAIADVKDRLLRSAVEDLNDRAVNAALASDHQLPPLIDQK